MAEADVGRAGCLRPRLTVHNNTALVRDAGGRALAYKVTLGASPGVLNVPGTTGRFSLLVLLDGSVVEPMRIQGAPIAPPARPPVQDPSGVYRVGGGVIAPRVLESPKPRYTQSAMRARIEGEIRLSCVVNTDGRCEDITILQSLDRDNGLDEEAINTLRQWRFTPGTLEGQPVNVRVIVELSFNLRDRK